jgi:hypothetical protein
LRSLFGGQRADPRDGKKSGCAPAFNRQIPIPALDSGSTLAQCEFNQIRNRAAANHLQPPLDPLVMKKVQTLARTTLE